MSDYEENDDFMCDDEEDYGLVGSIDIGRNKELPLVVEPIPWNLSIFFLFIIRVHVDGWCILGIL